MTEVSPPVRYCHGCGVYDNAPRVHDIPNANDPQTTRLYHYQTECVPQDVYDSLPDEVRGLVAAGHKDDDLRAQIVAVAPTLEG